MAFDRPTLKEITKRIEKGIESRLFGKTALLRRAVLRILARVFAGAIHTCYGFIESVVKQLFVTTATDEWLDRHGLMWGINRKPGSFASGQALFRTAQGGAPSAILPADTRIQSEDGIEYATVTEITLALGAGVADIQAVEDGEDGNLEVENGLIDPVIFQLISPVNNVANEVEIQNSITGGQDAEKDEPYRKRILHHIQFPPMGGNQYDYVEWATSVNGVDQAWSYPLANGPGTVVVVITATGANPVPSALLLSDVNAYISDVKPVGSTTTTRSIEDSTGSGGTAEVEYNIEIYPLTQQIQDNILENIADLFYPFKPGDVLKISQVRGAISNAGASDYSILDFYVDGGLETVDDYDFPGYAYPALDNINFSEKAQ